ncbi:MAG: hypothetical protein ACUVX8_14720 [Candidatus Zipacnadales bacterium]
MTPTKDELRELIGHFRAKVPVVARELARDTAKSMMEGFSAECPLDKWVRTRGGRIVIAGGVGLFLVGFMAGRCSRVTAGSLLRTTAVAAAGFVVGFAVGSQLNEDTGILRATR